jgi:alanyl-tRNA synthetase
MEDQLGKAAAALRAAPAEVPERVEKLLVREKERDREVAELKRKLALEAMKAPAAGAVDGVGAQAGAAPGVREVAGVKVYAARVEVGEPKVLRELADTLRQQHGAGVVFLAGVAGDKANLLAATAPEVRAKVSAGKLVREIAALVGARGGGKDDLAQAGGGDQGKLDEAVQSVVERMLANG